MLRLCETIAMKHGTLRSIAHNMADSLASGVSLLIGHYDLDVFGDAARSDAGMIGIDFLNGAVTIGRPSSSLVAAVRDSRAALEYLCRLHGVAIGAFQQLDARYGADPVPRTFNVTITDERGRQTTTEYRGIPGKRVKILDHLGRLRPKPVMVCDNAVTSSAA